MNFPGLHRTLATIASTVALLGAGGAEASFRTYLTSTGLDTDPCTLQQPCRLLPAALAAVDPGGEIWILDSANFNTGTVTVNKSVTILAIPGAVGSVVANSGDAMTINGASIRVTLRNLVFVNLVGSNNNGVSFTQGSSLTIRDSSFTGLGSAGVYIGSIGMKGQIINSTFDRNGAGVRVFGGLVGLSGNNIVNNIIAVEAGGPGFTGPSGGGTFPPQGTTRVRVTGGNILNNATVFHMDSAGPRPASGGCNGSNIFVHQDNGGYHINILDFTTYVDVTGASDHNVGCTNPLYDIQPYQSPYAY
jgi:hypothetical protein